MKEVRKRTKKAVGQYYTAGMIKETIGQMY